MFNLFKLPPVSERHMNQAFLRLLKPTTTWRVDQDDNYIYYLLLRNDITFASVFCNSTSISGHSIHLYYMTISIDPADKARSVAYAFSWKVAPLMLALFMPYAWLLFRANIDIREFDLLKRVPKFATRMEGKRSKIIKWSLIIVAVFLADMFLPPPVLRGYSTITSHARFYAGAVALSLIFAVSVWRKHVRHPFGRCHGLPALAALRPLLQFEHIERKYSND